MTSASTGAASPTRRDAARTRAGTRADADTRLRAGTSAYRRANLALFAAGLATFALLYSTQALLPALSTGLHLSPAQASLTVTASTGALAVALGPQAVDGDGGVPQRARVVDQGVEQLEVRGRREVEALAYRPFAGAGPGPGAARDVEHRPVALGQLPARPTPGLGAARLAAGTGGTGGRAGQRVLVRPAAGPLVAHAVTFRGPRSPRGPGPRVRGYFCADFWALSSPEASTCSLDSTSLGSACTAWPMLRFTSSLTGPHEVLLTG